MHIRTELEEELNEGGWRQDEPEGDLRRSLVRATGISAAVYFSTLMFHRQRSKNSMELSYSEPDPVTPYGVIRPHPVNFDSADDSDVESVRRMPISHNLDLSNNSTYAASIDDGLKFERKGKMKDVSIQSEVPMMLDRSCSPFPQDCFESEVDSEERFGLATGLWHFTPTSVPESIPDESLEDAIHSKQKQWLKELINEKEEPEDEEQFVDTKKLKHQSNNKEGSKLAKAVTVGDTTWTNVVRYLWGTPQETKQSENKSKNKLEDFTPSD